MTKERFYKLAIEAGLDTKNPALETMWNNRPPEIDNQIYDSAAEEILKASFAETTEGVRQIMSTFNN